MKRVFTFSVTSTLRKELVGNVGVVPPATEVGNVQDTEFDSAVVLSPAPLYPLKFAYLHIEAPGVAAQSPAVPAVKPGLGGVTPPAFARRTAAPARHAASAAVCADCL